MRRLMIFARLIGVLGLACWLIGAATFSAAAQDATPEPDPGGEEPVEVTATGTLSVAVYVCTDGEAGTAAVILDFAPSESCVAATTFLSIDGIDQGEVGAADFTLDAGVHTVTDQNTCAAADVEVVADAVASVGVVSYIAAEEPPADDDDAADDDAADDDESATVTLRLVKHVCAPGIQTLDQFNALADASAKLVACPVITLPENAGPDGAAHGTPATFDVTVSDAEGDPQTLANATFTPSSVCESALGLDLNNNPNDDACFDTSSYDFTVDVGAVSIVESLIPDQHRLGAAEPGPDDALSLTVDPDLAQVDADLSGDPAADGEVVIHLYNFAPPRVSVVQHLCGDEITNQQDFDALADFGAKLAACPVVTLDGNDGPEAAESGGYAEFAMTVTDADGPALGIGDATFVPDEFCESELAADVNNDPNDNACFNASFYAFDGILPGSVGVTQDAVPDGFAFGAVGLGPADGNPTGVDPENQSATLDTTNDGDVTVHFYAFAVPDGDDDDDGGNTGGGDDDDDDGGNTGGGGDDDDDDDGGNTGGGGDDDDDDDTGGGGNGGGNGDGTGGDDDGDDVGATGMVLIYKLYCLSDEYATYIEPLPPGMQVDPMSFGDETCIYADAEFVISEHGQSDGDVFGVGDDGEELIYGVPVTGEDGPHLLIELFTEEAGEFEVEADTITEIVVLNYEYGEFEDEDYEDEEDYYEEELEAELEAEREAEARRRDVDGDGVPDTGVALISPTRSGLPFFLVGAATLLLLAGANRLRRVNRW